ncbi:MAG: murein biosynthesis integral membrane protein MurJ, partial [Pseudomonadota bacterium]
DFAFTQDLGFGRDILIAAGLGTGPVADAFIVAFRLPNLFRRVLGEGALNAAFVPLFARRLEDDKANGTTGTAVRFAEEALAFLATVLLVISAVLIIAMPLVTYFLAAGFADDQGKFQLTVELSQLAFPYLFCMSIVALLSGVLNALQRYWAAAAAPILLNLVLISAISTALWLGYGEQPDAGYIMASAVAGAGFVQLAMLWIAVRMAGVRLRLRLPRYTPGVKRLVELGIPGIIAGGITQINIVIGTNIASLQDGAVSFLYYADRLYQLPLGIVGIAIGVVLLPELSRQLRAGDHARASDTQNRAMEAALLLTLPAAVALAVVAVPIISVLFERGAFGPDDTQATAYALAAFAFGLPAFVLIKVLQPAFFAREDTKTPMRFAIINMAVNVVGSLILFFAFQAMGWMPHVGIAVATSIAAWINTALLWWHLRASGEFAADRRLVRNLPLIAVASLAMGAALYFGTPVLDPYLGNGAALISRIFALGVVVVGGAAVFFAMAAACGVISPATLKQMRSRA